MLNKTQRRVILSASNDLRAMRESIAADIHKGDLKAALEGVSLLGQIAYELRRTAHADPVSETDVITRPADLPAYPRAIPVTFDQAVLITDCLGQRMEAATDSLKDAPYPGDEDDRRLLAKANSVLQLLQVG